MATDEQYNFTVARLREALRGYPDDAIVHIEGAESEGRFDLTRVKHRGKMPDGCEICHLEIFRPE